MSPTERKRLEKLLKSLEEGLDAVRELLNEPSRRDKRDTTRQFDVSEILNSIKLADRSEINRILNELKQHELGSVFVASGGPSAERKRPKVWLIEQILWRLRDFDSGHDAIRGRGSSVPTIKEPDDK